MNAEKDYKYTFQTRFELLKNFRSVKKTVKNTFNHH